MINTRVLQLEKWSTYFVSTFFLFFIPEWDTVYAVYAVYAPHWSKLNFNPRVALVNFLFAVAHLFLY